MLHEFALDPEVICDKASARYFFDACKAEKGRLISQFPGKWKRKVCEHCKAVVPDGTSLKYIEERLAQLGNNLVRMGRAYDSEQGWVANAVSSHNETPFRAIVSTCSGPSVLSADVDEDTPEWRVDTCVAVQRRPTPLAAGCEGLLKAAKELVFVDPFFSGNQLQMSVLIEFLSRALDGSPVERLEYHVKERVDSGAYEQRLLQDVAPNLPDLPVPFYIIRWQNGAETLHDRYILTNLAGVTVGQGLSECRADETDTTDISLLGQEGFERRRFQYSAENDGCFKFVDGWCIRNGQIDPVTIKDGKWSV